MPVFLAQFIGFLKDIPVWAWIVVAAVGYNYWIENPRIANDARQGYVREAEKAAIESELREVKRQRDAAERSAAAWQEQLQRYQEEAKKRSEEVEKDIAEFEAAIAAGGRSCKLTDADIKFLRK